MTRAWHERRPLSGSDVVDRLLQGAVGLFVVAAVALEHLEIGERARERGDGATGGLMLYGDRDGVPVVLDQEEDRQPP